LTLTKAYWPDSADASPFVRNNRAADDRPRFFIHADEWLDDAGDYLQYRPFLARVDLDFALRAASQPDIRCRASSLFLTDASQHLREFEVVIPPHEFAKMAKNVRYTLHPANANPGYRWQIKEGLTLARAASVDEKLEAALKRLDELESRVRALENPNR